MLRKRPLESSDRPSKKPKTPSSQPVLDDTFLSSIGRDSYSSSSLSFSGSNALVRSSSAKRMGTAVSEREARSNRLPKRKKDRLLEVDVSKEETQREKKLAKIQELKDKASRRADVLKMLKENAVNVDLLEKMKEAHRPRNHDKDREWDFDALEKEKEQEQEQEQELEQAAETQSRESAEQGDRRREHAVLSRAQRKKLRKRQRVAEDENGSDSDRSVDSEDVDAQNRKSRGAEHGRQKGVELEFQQQEEEEEEIIPSQELIGKLEKLKLQFKECESMFFWTGSLTERLMSFVKGFITELEKKDLHSEASWNRTVSSIRTLMEEEAKRSWWNPRCKKTVQGFVAALSTEQPQPLATSSTPSSSVETAKVDAERNLSAADDKDNDDDDDDDDDDEDEDKSHDSADEPFEEYFPPIKIPLPDMDKPVEDGPKLTLRDIVRIHRSAEVELHRSSLPALSAEADVLEAVANNPIILVSGSTGSGKTTQIPQMLYEQGYQRFGKIGVTQPRRVAATSIARRVAFEMNFDLGKEVGYVVRHDSKASDQVSILFMTDGILLRQLQKDPLLMEYSVIMIDEAHERSVTSDILIGVLSRIVHVRWTMPENRKLRVILMSATLRVEEFRDSLKQHLPLVAIENRQFPVEVHFARETPDDYVQAAFDRVLRIHATTKLEGGVLVFMTGREEVERLCKMLHDWESNRDEKLRQLALRRAREKEAEEAEEEKKNGDVIILQPERFTEADATVERNEFMAALDVLLQRKQSEESLLPPMSSHNDAKGVGKKTTKNNKSSNSSSKRGTKVETASSSAEEEEEEKTFLHILPLFALMDMDRQNQVFEPAPSPKHRLVVVATNVAESSLTIPGIRFVVDSGRHKTREYSAATGVGYMRNTWIARSNSDQRAGRAGRVGPGVCWRLFSSAVFANHMPQWDVPELAKAPLEGVVLQILSLGVPSVRKFPFLTAPAPSTLDRAIELLTVLGAIVDDTETLSPLGHSIAKLPVHPRYGKLLLLSKANGLLEYAISLVAALSVREIIPSFATLTEEQKQKILHLSHPKSDFITFLRIMGAAEFSLDKASFCNMFGVLPKPLSEALNLKRQLHMMFFKKVPEKKLPPPSQEDQDKLLTLIASCYLDRVARRATLEELNVKNLKREWFYFAMGSDKPVRIYRDSGVSRHVTTSSTVREEDWPELLIFDSMEDKEVRRGFSQNESAAVAPQEGKKTILDKKDKLDVENDHDDYAEMDSDAEKETKGPSELVEKHRYIRMVSCITPDVLLQVDSSERFVKRSKPLETPCPFYDPEEDRIMAHYRVSYNRDEFDLGIFTLAMPFSLESIRWIARGFLEGCLFEGFPRNDLDKRKTFLSTSPSLATRGSVPHPKAALLIQAIGRRKLTSARSFIEMWQKEPMALWNEYSEWLVPEHRVSPSMSGFAWPPVDVSLDLDASFKRRSKTLKKSRKAKAKTSASASEAGDVEARARRVSQSQRLLELELTDTVEWRFLGDDDDSEGDASD
eukprot:ANDGO_01594.mRNA.1 putative ATP-dependent RNA helicase kurz